MKTLYLTDLDDTLFATARKILDTPLELCTTASTLVDGTPSGYRTPRMQALWELLGTGDVVPVTARGRDVLARCDVPQAPAICSNGGVIVDANGGIDREWHDGIVAMVGDGEELRHLDRTIGEMAGPRFRHWTVDEEGVPLYLVVKNNDTDEEAVRRLSIEIRDGHLPKGWRLHRNGNNIALTPPWISKRKAVRHLIDGVRRIDPQRLVIGLGDSESDLGFMDECDYAMFPARSQIAQRLGEGHDW